MIKHYVISLDKAAERHEHISKIFSAQQIAFEFFSAIAPETVHSSKERLGIKASNGKLSVSEVACFLSHAELWQRVIDDDLAVMGIFEDDIHLGQGAAELLTYDDWINSGVVTRLEVHNRRAKLSNAREHSRLKNRKLYRLNSLQMGAAGYLLSKSAAKFYLNKLRTLSELIAVDHFLFEIYLSEHPEIVEQLNPALVIQDDLLTSATRKYRLPNYLEQKRGVRVDKPQRNFLSKLKREFIRLFVQLWKVITYHKIYFR